MTTCLLLRCSQIALKKKKKKKEFSPDRAKFFRTNEQLAFELINEAFSSKTQQQQQQKKKKQQQQNVGGVHVGLLKTKDINLGQLCFTT